MKKTILFALALGIGGVIFAQNTTSQVGAKYKNQAAPYLRDAFMGNESTSNLLRDPNPVTAASSKAINETVIGQTTYDLQTNSTVMNRVINHGDGTISGTWTYSSSGDLAASDRGTGYNYYSGSAWAGFPTARQEASTRTGWSSISRTSTNGEVIINHPGSTGLHILTRSAKGTGAWTEATIPTNTNAGGILWPRAVTAGANGQTIHCIAITAPVANNGTLYQGMDGALLYWRSQDGGATWDIQDSILTGLDSTTHIGFSADAYAIDAVGDVVAFAIFNDLDDVILMKSTDNGSNWTHTVVKDFPITKYDAQAAGTITDFPVDGIADTLESSDNSGAIVIDGNNQVHVAYGYMRYLDDDPAAGSNFSYFPFLDGIMYWNEGMGATEPVVIANIRDLDGDGQINFTPTDAASVPGYFVSQTGFPSMGVDANNVLYMTYSGHVENLNQGSQDYRHVYAIASDDGGANWSCPLDITPYPTHEFDECVFASLARDVDGQMHVTYQMDNEPGLAVRGDEDPFGTNEIRYITVDTADVIDYVCPNVSINELDGNINGVNVFPNPAKNMVKLVFNLVESDDVTVSVSNIMGQEVIALSNQMNRVGVHSIELNINDLKPGIYFVNIKSNDEIVSQKFIKQ